MSGRFVLASVALVAALGIGGAFAAGTSGGGGSSSGGTPADPIVPADGTQNITGGLTTSGGITATTGAFSGVIKAPDGSAAAPAYAFTATPASGMYSSGGYLRFSQDSVNGLQLGNSVAYFNVPLGSNGNTTLGDAATDTTDIYGPVSNPGAGTPTGCATAGAVCVSDAAGLEVPAGTYVKQGTVTTTDATLTTVLTLPTATDTVTSYLNIMCTGIQDDESSAGAFLGSTLLRNAAGVVSYVAGAPTTLATVWEDDAATAASITISGTNLLVQVTGVAAQTWNWRCRAPITQAAP